MTKKAGRHQELEEAKKAVIGLGLANTLDFGL
jgi:hypothetical protein